MDQENKEVKAEENKQASKFEYVSLYLINISAAPVEGQSSYFVISQTDKRVVLLHPFTLTKFAIPNITFQMGLVATEPISNHKVVEMLTKKRDAMKASNRKAPYTEVNEIIAHYSAA
jgi:hypothetical protein